MRQHGMRRVLIALSLLTSALSVTPSFAHDNPACGGLLVLGRGHSAAFRDTFLIGTSTNEYTHSCTQAPSIPLRLVGSPSGRADLTESSDFPGLFVRILRSDGGSIDNVQEWWAGQISTPQLNFRSQPDFLSFQKLECSDPQVPGDANGGILPYFDLYRTSDSALFFPTVGSGEVNLYVKFNNESYGLVGSISASTTDLDTDGDTDEADEAIMRSALRLGNTQLDLNWSGVMDSTDLLILMKEARRRDSSGARYRRKICVGPGYYDYEYPTGAEIEVAPPSAPDNFTASSSCGYWKLRWRNGGDDDTLGRAWALEIRTSTDSITATNFNSSTVIQAPAPGDSAQFQELLTSYPVTATPRYFAIRSIDDSGEPSTEPRLLKAVPDETTLPATTSNLTAVRQAGQGPGGQARLQWTSAGDDGSSGTPACYDLRYSDGPISSANFAGAVQIESPSTVTGGTQVTHYFQMDECQQYYFALRTIDDQGNRSAVSNSPTSTGFCWSELITGEQDGTTIAPKAIALAARNLGASSIEFLVDVPSIRAGKSARIVIHDVLGREVASVRTGALQAGRQPVAWNAKTSLGSPAPAGVYAAKLFLDGETRSAKFSVLR